MPKKIALISSGQPSLNPRLVKEADALSEAGYDVIVIYQYWNDWGTELDTHLLPQKKWNAIRVGGNPMDDKKHYLLSRLIHKFAKFAYKRFGNIAFLPELAISRTTLYLLKEAKKTKADLYIGHNLGALPATVLAASHFDKPCGFDAEDFHRYEMTDDDRDIDVRVKKHLETKYYPKLSYLTAASPLIANAYAKLFPALNIEHILNVFEPEVKIANSKNIVTNKPLKLFWFSQTIGKDRGLEIIIQAIAELRNFDIELHLLGSIRQQDKVYFEDLIIEHVINKDSIVFHDPIPSDKIVSFASDFDLGLATETGTPYNRDICLTNKIFTYINSGLALIASNTSAQIDLLRTHKDVGLIYDRHSVDSVKNTLLTYLNDPDILLRHKENSSELGRSVLNWHNEKHKFLKIVANLI